MLVILLSVDYTHIKEYSSLTTQDSITNIAESKTKGSLFDFSEPTE
jgi:hypothetical protein